MRSWPAMLFALSGLLFAIGVTLSALETSGPLADAGGVSILSAFLLFPLAVLMALASMLQRAGDEAQRRWRVRIAVFCFLAWLAAIFVVWAGLRTGGGGLDGPCAGSEVHLATEGSGCSVETAPWPPLSSRTIVTAPDGTVTEDVFPNTPEVIGLVALALLPLVAWPLALWLTASRRGSRPPVKSLLIFLAVAAALIGAGAALTDEERERAGTDVQPALG